MLEHPDGQISLTDPDARSMATSGRGTGIVGYNVQTAVDTTHHLIVAHEVTNLGHDRTQLSNMARQAKAALSTDTLTVVADRGYYSGEEILACEQSQVTVYLPKPRTSGNQAKGLFARQDFIYDAKEDAYRCPAGERLPRRMSGQEKGRRLYRYWSSACRDCAMKSRYTTGKERRVTRWKHEAVLDAAEERLEREPQRMRTRRQTVEHPFAASHFLTRRLGNVSTEMSLHVLAYNLKRTLNLIGPTALRSAIQDG